MTLSAEKYRALLNEMNAVRANGKVTQIIGLTIESQGPDVKIGELCLIYPSKDASPVRAEVVGFRENHVLLMPLGDIEAIGPGCDVAATGKPLTAKAGMELMGKVLDGLGRPLDSGVLPSGMEEISTHNSPPNPLDRKRIDAPLSIGIRSIDGLHTVGKGQRVGIFAGSGVGKSSLLGMVARNTSADVNVIALVGERGREVLEFIETNLGEEGLRKSVVIAATSDQPALIRIKGAMLATSIAEYYRDQGMDVMLMMDSVTRIAMAQREIGLTVGEPPTTRGYTPSVFAMLPKLLERTGTSDVGSITAFYTVLVDGDDMNEPVADTVRGILDGHIVLDRELAERGHYPAVNVVKSISRVMKDITSQEHRKAAERLKKLVSVYRESEDLINIGAYKRGSNKEIDLSIQYKNRIDTFLIQGEREPSHFEQTVEDMIAQFGEVTS